MLAEPLALEVDVVRSQKRPQRGVNAGRAGLGDGNEDDLLFEIDRLVEERWRVVFGNHLVGNSVS